MVKKLLQLFIFFFKRHHPLLVIALVVFFVSATNIVPGTYLSGWDNLHPEFDFLTNLRRAVFGVWQEYQGLGVLGGNAHPTEALRVLFLWMLSATIPQSLLRYTYHLLFWFIGGVGAYYLSRKLFAPQRTSHHKSGTNGPLITALFYLLNIGTLQNFYLPYEAFTHHFAFLPWLILSLYTFLEKPTRKHLALFAVINLLATPMFYIPTIFIVYSFVFITVCGAFLLHHFSRPKILTIITAALIFVIVNLYWLLPFGYFVSQGTKFVTQSSINAIFTDEAFLRNQMFGALPTAVIMKGFWFGTTDMADSSGKQQLLMGPWVDFTNALPTQLLLYSFFICAILGIGALFVKKNAYRFPLTILFALCLFALINDNFPTGFIFKYFQDTIPLFKQVFRLPFTKFIVLTSLLYSILIGYAALTLGSYLRTALLRKFVTFLFIAAILYGALPSLQGNFFYAKMRVTIPAEYFTVFSYFQKDPTNGKVAYLPQPTFWGWVTYDWGYRGSGFPWYGVPQPILDRAFDVWSLKNEDYYHELSYALYEHDDAAVLQQVLDKYAVSFIWIDGSIISPHKPLLSDAVALEKKVAQLGDFEKVLTVGKQQLFKRKSTALPLSSSQAILVDKNTRFSLFDAYYATYGNYITQDGAAQPERLPFGDLDSRIHSWTTRNTPDGTLLTAEMLADPLIFSNSTLLNQAVRISLQPAESGTVQLTSEPPQFNNGQASIFATPPTFDSRQMTSEPIEFISAGATLVSLGQNKQTISIDSQQFLAFFTQSDLITAPISTQLFTSNPTNCNEDKREDYTIRFNEKQEVLSLSGMRGTKPCVYQKLSVLLEDPQSAATAAVYDLLITLKPSSAAQLAVCLTVEGKETCLVNTQTSQRANATEWVTYKYTVPSARFPVSSTWLKLELRPTASGLALIEVKEVMVRINGKPSFTLPAKTFVPIQNGNQTNQVYENLTLSLPASQSTTIHLKDLPNTARNCYPFGAGSYDRTIEQENGLSFVRYSASNASSCETVFLGSSFTEGALITIKTRSISGRPLKVCLRHDPPGHCIHELVLPVEKRNEWQEQQLIVPPLQTESRALYLEFDNFALGNEKRVNDVSFIKIDPLPFGTLVGIHTIPQQKAETQPAEKIHPSSQKKYEFYYYTAHVRGPTTLNLDQTYRAGWIAFSLKDAKLFTHGQFNGWANAWIIPEGEWNIVILYWPQLVSFLGYGCLTALTLTFLKNRR